MKIVIKIFLVLIISHSSIFCQESFYKELADSALSLTNEIITYDPGYFSIEYPNGDIPSGKGVCTDVVIRAYRKVGIDLQVEVHKDMEANFSEYPKNWGLRTTDTNIDHRRVPNLMKFFERNGNSMGLSVDPNDYAPGDIVCWDLGRGITHIGIVIDRRSSDNRRYLIVHNIGSGQVTEDILFKFKIIGHYKYKDHD